MEVIFIRHTSVDVPPECATDKQMFLCETVSNKKLPSHPEI